MPGITLPENASAGALLQLGNNLYPWATLVPWANFSGLGYCSCETSHILTGGMGGLAGAYSGGLFNTTET
jgi:hypothetical protein